MTIDDQDDDYTNDDEAIDSSDEALCEMLGLKSFDLPIESNVDVDDKNDGRIPRLTKSQIVKLIQSRYSHLADEYQRESICFLPSELWIPAAHMRRLTDELVWGGDRVQADRTYENIQVISGQSTVARRTLARLENFVSAHQGWQQLADYLGQCLSVLLNTEYVLYKEKLNLKPPGGSGFAPHLDTPSLRMAWSTMSDELGPKTFVTIVVAIDDMRAENGCLRICKGAWSEIHHCPLIPPDPSGSPDAAGRAGAIPLDVANELHYDDVTCRGGAIAVFNGWAPHRSAPNASGFPRRAVFLTYNPKDEGDFHDSYYQRMAELRNKWRKQNLGCELALDPSERDALATIPRI